jgi:hypothetical protein
MGWDHGLSEKDEMVQISSLLVNERPNRIQVSVLRSR